MAHEHETNAIVAPKAVQAEIAPTIDLPTFREVLRRNQESTVIANFVASLTAKEADDLASILTDGQRVILGAIAGGRASFERLLAGPDKITQDQAIAIRLAIAAVDKLLPLVALAEDILHWRQDAIGG